MNGNLCKSVTLAFEISRISKVTAAMHCPGLQISCIWKSSQRGWEKSAQKQECNQNVVFSGLQETGRQGHKL